MKLNGVNDGGEDDDGDDDDDDDDEDDDNDDDDDDSVSFVSVCLFFCLLTFAIICVPTRALERISPLR